jgi:hypothetical protein
MSTVQEIPLSKLVPSSRNVRRTGAAEGVAELAASIAAHGAAAGVLRPFSMSRPDISGWCRLLLPADMGSMPRMTGSAIRGQPVLSSALTTLGAQGSNRLQGRDPTLTGRIDRLSGTGGARP